MSSDAHDGSRAHGSPQVLATMELGELVALGDDLDRRVREGTATLEDFGALDRARNELARRARDGGST